MPVSIAEETEALARTVDAIARVVRQNAFRFDAEKDLQDGLAGAFAAAELEFGREHRLGAADIVDFLFAGGLGLEVKVRGPAPDVVRQLHRYAGYAPIRALVLVTTRRAMAVAMPGSLQQKPLIVLVTAGALA